MAALAFLPVLGNLLAGEHFHANRFDRRFLEW